MYAACLSRIRHFDIAMRYAGPTAAAWWHIKVYPIPKHKRELASKLFRLQPGDSQPESPITKYLGGYISATFYPKLKQTSQNLKLDTAHEHKNCSWDVPPLPTAQRSAGSPHEAACSWVADTWAPKGPGSQHTTAFTLLLYGRSSTEIPAQLVADGSTQRL